MARVELDLSPDLLMILDDTLPAYDQHGAPMVVMSFVSMGERATMPSFTVGIPAKQWPEIQKAVAALDAVKVQ